MATKTKKIPGVMIFFAVITSLGFLYLLFKTEIDAWLNARKFEGGAVNEPANNAVGTTVDPSSPVHDYPTINYHPGDIVVSNSSAVNLRTGPSTTYASVAEVGKDVTLGIFLSFKGSDQEWICFKPDSNAMVNLGLTTYTNLYVYRKYVYNWGTPDAPEKEENVGWAWW